MPIGTEQFDPHIYYNRGRSRPSDLMNSLLDRTTSENTTREATPDEHRQRINESLSYNIRAAELDRSLRMGRVGMGTSSPSITSHGNPFRYEILSPSSRLSSDDIRHISDTTNEEIRLRPGLFTNSEGRWNSLGPTETNDHTIFNQIMSRYPPFHERTDVDKERLTEELVELLVYRS